MPDSLADFHGPKAPLVKGVPRDSATPEPYTTPLPPLRKGRGTAPKGAVVGSNTRLPWPDLARGIGIFLVQLGHSGLVSDPWKYWIYSFHMPMFFFVSGWFMSLHGGSVGKSVRKRAFALIPTYLAYSLLRWLFAWMNNGAADWNKLLGVLLNLPDSDYDGYVWFFLGLFGAEVVMLVLMKLLKKPPLVLLGCCAAAGVALVWQHFELPRWLWHLDGAMLLLPFAGLGWLLRQYQTRWEGLLKKKAFLLPFLAAMLGVNILTCWLNGKGTWWHIDYNSLILHDVFTCYLTGVTGTVFFLLVCRLLPNIKPLTFVGRNSGVYYCIGWLGSNVLHQIVYALGLAPHGGWLLLVHMLGAWLIPIVPVLILNRWFPWLVGKRG